jgi:hypothetical protein
MHGPLRSARLIVVIILLLRLLRLAVHLAHGILRRRLHALACIAHALQRACGGGGPYSPARFTGEDIGELLLISADISLAMLHVCTVFLDSHLFDASQKTCDNSLKHDTVLILILFELVPRNSGTVLRLDAPAAVRVLVRERRSDECKTPPLLTCTRWN